MSLPLYKGFEGARGLINLGGGGSASGSVGGLNSMVAEMAHRCPPTATSFTACGHIMPAGGAKVQRCMRMRTHKKPGVDPVPVIRRLPYSTSPS